ncbi:phosphatidate cytidylyltransferase [Methylococcus mesophilus]|uniref:phosphatidate cytidylyltransferase n=1 Tax=Methylococcus mesophilus TaxID=2993564 RepID=UPI00224A595F|nr:phosphatidate cytidylyltransferase [Methylococcus mesophilus]UZR29618.1 phosphatidate cytidylyltransferase [Methylococcus mesophilus]
MTMDRHILWLAAGILGALVVASVIGAILAARIKTEAGRATVSNLNARTRAWWVMAFIFGGALALGQVGAVVLFGLLSFLGLREFITLTPTKRGDHRALFWMFFVITPAQYWLVARGWYGMFAIFIPVYAFLFLPVRSALAGDCENFLERTAKAQWGLMVCVYCLSYTPALLALEIPGFEGRNAELVIFLILVVQMSDVLQYVWGKTVGRHKVAPTVSPGKTWEGLIGGVLSASALAAGLWWATPFTPWQAGLTGFAICIAGFCGGLVMSAIKRDRGVKDYGALIEGHGGVMDRVDSLCFAAPLFFHLVRYFWT